MGHVLKREERRKFVLTLLAIFGVGGVAVGYILQHYFYPNLYFKWYPLLPATYLLLGLAFIYALDKILYRDPKKRIVFYMVLRNLKTVLTFLVVLLYVLLVHEREMSFIILTIAHYFTYLGLETWIFYSYERRWYKRKAKTE